MLTNILIKQKEKKMYEYLKTTLITSSLYPTKTVSF